jgi:hypothetical protein
MKDIKLKPLPPRYGSALPWDRKEALAVLPPRNDARYATRGQFVATTDEERRKIPRKLVDAVARREGISKGSVRKAIAAGRVYVQGPRGDGAVFDPDYVLADDERYEIAPEAADTSILETLSTDELLQVAPVVAMLKGHDWTYDFSDDVSCWRAGDEHRRKILEALKTLRPELAQALWTMYSPGGGLVPR